MQRKENTPGGEMMHAATLTRPEATAANELLSLEAAALFLGLKKSYLYKLTSTRQIPFYKYGGRLIKFERAALESWRAARLQVIPTQAEQAEQAAAYCVANPLK